MREFTEADLPAVLEIGERFHAFSPWRDRPFNRFAVTDTLARMSANPDAVVLFNGSGVLGGLIYPMYFGGGTVAQELFWFADRAGMQLLDWFEQWAKAKRADGVSMISLSIDDRTDGVMEKLYTRRGYELREKAYWRAF